ELGVDAPSQQQPLRRIPREHLAPGAFGAVFIDLVPTAAGARFDDSLLERGRTELVSPRPPAVDAGGEDLEGALRRGLDADGLPDGRRLDHQTHGVVPFPSPSASRSTSALNASSA